MQTDVNLENTFFYVKRFIGWILSFAMERINDWLISNFKKDESIDVL